MAALLLQLTMQKNDRIPTLRPQGSMEPRTQGSQREVCSQHCAHFLLMYYIQAMTPKEVLLALQMEHTGLPLCMTGAARSQLSVGPELWDTTRSLAVSCSNKSQPLWPDHIWPSSAGSVECCLCSPEFGRSHVSTTLKPILGLGNTLTSWKTQSSSGAELLKSRQPNSYLKHKPAWTSFSHSLGKC